MTPFSISITNIFDFLIEYIESGEAYSYDDVVSETYVQIQDYFYRTHTVLTDEVEDRIYEEIMSMLDRRGYIDHKRGILLFGE